MTVGLSLAPHIPFSVTSDDAHHSVFKKLSSLNLSPQDSQTLSVAANQLLFSGRPTPKKFEGHGKTFKATTFRSQEGTEIYFHEMLPPEEKATRRKNEENAHLPPKTKQFFKSVHVTFKDNQVFVENAGLLKYQLKSDHKTESFNHELNILNIVKDIPEASHLQNSTTYQGRSDGKECKKGLIYLDYYESGDLESFLQNLSEPLTYQQRMSITHDLLKGLAQLETLHILHNDLKPTNILVGSDLKTVIADFEFALSREDYQNDAKSHSFLLAKGTPLFLSSDRLKYSYEGKKHPKPGLPSNAWGIGCVLYFLWENEYPKFFHEIDVFFKAFKEFCANENKETIDKVLSAQKAMYACFDRMQNECENHPPETNVSGLIQQLINPDAKGRLTGQKALDYFDSIANIPSSKNKRLLLRASND